MSRKFQYQTTELMSGVIVVEGDNLNSNVPRDHRFWKEWGVDVAEANGEILFVSETVDDKLDYPDSYQQPVDEPNVLDDEATRTRLLTQNYELIDIETLKHLRLEELKQARKDAIDRGFLYKGKRVIADRDANGDVMAVLMQYQSGQFPSTYVFAYKVGPANYLTLDVESNGVTTDDGLVGFTHFSNAMMHFVNQECFGKERAASEHIVSLTTAQEVADLVLDDIYHPDMESDYAEH